MFSVLLTSLLTLSSCEKDRLTHRAEVLIGEWQCISVWRHIGNEEEELLNAETIDLVIEFKERGIVKFIRDGKCIEKSRIEHWSSTTESFRFTVPGLEGVTGSQWGVQLLDDSHFKTSGITGLLSEDVWKEEEYKYVFERIY